MRVVLHRAFHVPHADHKGAVPHIWVSRWKGCKVFPVDERDIEEVALMGGSCGCHFERMPGE